MEPEFNTFCHKCKIFVSKDETLDCIDCRNNARCVECIPNSRKVYQMDGSFKYRCLPCMRGTHGLPHSLYEMLNKNPDLYREFIFSNDVQS